MRSTPAGAQQRVKAARLRLASTIVVTAVIWGVTTSTLVSLLSMILGHVTALSSEFRSHILIVAIIAGVAVACAKLWRGRFAISLDRVALWIEERVPALDYALVTAIDAQAAPANGRAARVHPTERAILEAVVARFAFENTVNRAARTTFIVPLVALMLCSAALVLLSSKPAATSRDSRRSAQHTLSAPPLESRLMHLNALVVPPSYSGEPSQTVDEPVNVAALAGSAVTFSGVGSADGIRAVIVGDTLRTQSLEVASQDDERWTVRVQMPERPAALRFTDRSYDRLVILESRLDSAPVVSLTAPARDTTFRTPKGRLQLDARARDDIGLAYGYFDFLVTSGSDETFKTRVVTGTRISFANDRNRTFAATIELDTMKLGPGTFLHIRAIAFDGNNVSGPGRGISETRTIRIARADEYDSVAITPAAPLAIDTSLISQRMLIMRTETLLVRKPTLARPAFEEKSTQYSQTQEDIRTRVENVIRDIEMDESGSAFVTPVSALLHQASTEMWDARTSLGVAEPREALPSMRRALVLLQKAKEAHRLYLRGLIQQEVVNIDRVRLKGTDTAHASPRDPRGALSDARFRLDQRVSTAARSITRDPRAALDSLILIRLDALENAPSVAPTLLEAINALRGGQEATSSLARVHRALAPALTTHPTLSAWNGGERR